MLSKRYQNILLFDWIADISLNILNLFLSVVFINLYHYAIFKYITLGLFSSVLQTAARKYARIFTKCVILCPRTPTYL